MTFSVNIEDLTFHKENSLKLPDWLHGRAANCDLHTVARDIHNGHLMVANSYMDCIDWVDFDKGLIKRKFLWEYNSEILEMAKNRNVEAADLCHINHISRLEDEYFVTLCNLNGSDEGAIMRLSDGKFVLRGLTRPHDGFFSGDRFLLTNTGTKELFVYEGVSGLDDLATVEPKRIDIQKLIPDFEGKFWLRGLLVENGHIYVGCSQFQDRKTKETARSPSTIVVLDEKTYEKVDTIEIASAGNLKNPVIYSILSINSA
tara:strand:+ start:47 stop:823 length:777 start_codon:yes stop_codon:yes gene_type:complete